MKCAILCLLAWCAFETVFAKKPSKLELELDDLHTTSFNKFFEITDNLNAKIQGRIAAAEKKLKRVGVADTCMRMSEDINDGFEDKVLKCNQCHKAAAKKKDIESAKKCCTDILAGLEGTAKEIDASSQNCIEDCVKKGGCVEKKQFV